MANSLSNIKVKKRDGKLEDFDGDKIKKVIIAAGLSDKDADNLKDKISKWVQKNNKKVVTSIEIRDQILPIIQKMDDYASKKYIWWEEYKDKHFNK